MRHTRSTYQKLIIAAKCGSNNALMKHVKAGGLVDDFSGLALSYVVGHGDLAMCKFLVENGSYINSSSLKKAEKIYPQMFEYLVNSIRKQKLSRLNETA